MNTNFSTSTRNENLSRTERAVRVAVGFALLGSVMYAAPGVLGWSSLLALVAIYPIMTGLNGADPLRSVMEGHSAAYRFGQLALAAALIGTVIVAPIETLGMLALLPLIGIYAALGAILGRSPIATLVDANQTIPYVIAPVDDASALAPAAHPAARWVA